MGGSKPSPPTIIMPAEQSSTAYQTLIPKKSYKDLAQTTRRMEKEINRITSQRYDEVGTPAEIGARQRGLEMQESAAYLSSLPKSTPDTSFQTTPRPFDITATKNAFGQRVGQTIPASTGASSAPATAPKSQLDAVKDAAKMNLDNAKKEYLDAVKLAKTKGRPKATVTKDPSFAKQDPKDLLPKQYNPETGRLFEVDAEETFDNEEIGF